MGKGLTIISVLLGMLYAMSLSAQGQFVTLPKAKMSIKKVFSAIEEQSGLTIAYNEDLLDVYRKVAPPKSETTAGLLKAVLDGTGMEAVFQGKMILIVMSVSAQEQKLRQMKNHESEGQYINLIDEAVVVGYGTMHRSDISSAIGTFKTDDITARMISSPEALLQGRIAGVNVTASSGTPGSCNRVSIRGIGSLTAGNEPLYVVDGIPLSNTTSDTGSYGGETLNSLSDINPDDIESIQILKDAASAAIYGEATEKL